MIVKTLVENSTVSNMAGEHGLSIYIETDRHKILFDLGKSDLFLTNAAKMNVDIAAVDTVVISHGHFDHGGGLAAFLEANQRADIYLQKGAFDPHFAQHSPDKTQYIGLDPALSDEVRLHIVNGDLRLDEQLLIFSGVQDVFCHSGANDSLLVEKNGEKVRDDFAHEQHLAIRENGRTLLLAGCAHGGIINILERWQHLGEPRADVVVGGYHLFNPGTGICEPDLLVDEIGVYLKRYGARYYTGHCTGPHPYDRLKMILGDQLIYLNTGIEFIV